MRSWRSALFVIAFAGGVAACGTDSVTRDDGGADITDPSVCETSYLTYNNFGAGFTSNWCRGCHSSEVPEEGRQDAPVGVDFDTDADLARWSERIRARATGEMPTMPPAGGPSAEERALLTEWIDCGMN